MNLDHIEQELLQFVRSAILAPDINIDTHMALKSLGVDSFSIVEIILFIERKFGLVLRDEQLLPEHFVSIHAVAQLIYNDLK
jgi:acyl carrier protein